MNFFNLQNLQIKYLLNWINFKNSKNIKSRKLSNNLRVKIEKKMKIREFENFFFKLKNKFVNKKIDLLEHS